MWTEDTQLINTIIISDDVQTSVHCLKTVVHITTIKYNCLVSHKHHHPHHPWDYFQWPQQGLVGRRSTGIAHLSINVYQKSLQYMWAYTYISKIRNARLNIPCVA
jgi:hypothetical protein